MMTWMQVCNFYEKANFNYSKDSLIKIKDNMDRKMLPPPSDTNEVQKVNKFRRKCSASLM